MISKRIERGEELEVLDLLNEIVSKVEEILAKGGAG
jgi:methyl coenzyme M reductase subunit C-like uncharacterized protein (methanogenesis marker protein 7)